MVFKIKCTEFWKRFDHLYKPELPKRYKLEYISDTIQQYPEIVRNLGLIFNDTICWKEHTKPEPLSSYYIFNIIDEKKWLFSKLKYSL